MRRLLADTVHHCGDLRNIRCGRFNPEQVRSAFIQTGNTVSLQLRTTLNDLVIDDIRVQPYSSEMVCYVYDHAQRILASFDDQHFPLLYQYNEQGQLVRKQKVTREGVKTISETQYSTKGKPRF